ncbi:unnamed protein product [Kuraishia capsulata CBS 1993]|uniref:Uncharacterized protein n=1 Tax=Kuraishia capsulata CBS 1993 TaxID=1382522 RepID=W6MPU6_9ASCO|nr:uncharacterized protein KUCA_T00004728001 [Kuraishia capsulata CBS 1993]CDK28744.1 unnamed protein product [Kuraishia capsulata CBS 1993]
MFEYLKSQNSIFDINDRSTWVERNLPFHSPHNVFLLYECSHEDFMWDVRAESGVLEAYSRLWDTEKLLISFDGFNLGFPHRPDRDGVSPAWPRNQILRVI